MVFIMIARRPQQYHQETLKQTRFIIYTFWEAHSKVMERENTGLGFCVVTLCELKAYKYEFKAQEEKSRGNGQLSKSAKISKTKEQ